MSARFPHIIITTLLFIFAIENLLAQHPSEPVTIGHTFQFHSQFYDKEIKIFVSLPDGYDNATEKYPVLYSVQSYHKHVAVTVDDLSQAYIPKMIYVHVITYDSGDLIPTPIPGRPGSGGADQLITFFEMDLFPFIENQYRTQPFRMLQSGSWGGVFCLYTLLTRPDMFNAVMAFTPWLIYDADKSYILNHAESWLSAQSFKNHFLYTAIGSDSDEGLHERFDKFKGILDTNPREGLKFKSESMPEEDHMSITHKAVWEGLKWIFAPWNHIPESNILAGQAGLDQYAGELNKMYGYDIGLNATPVWTKAWDYMREKKFDQAVTCFQSFITLAPDRAYSYEGLGRCLEAKGDLKAALFQFNKAIQIASSKGGDFGRYADHVKRVEEKIATMK